MPCCKLFLQEIKQESLRSPTVNAGSQSLR